MLAYSAMTVSKTELHKFFCFVLFCFFNQYNFLKSLLQVLELLFFNDKLTTLKEYYYSQFSKSIELDNFNGNVIVLLGLTFEFDLNREYYSHVHESNKVYDPIDQICITEGF